MPSNEAKVRRTANLATPTTLGANAVQDIAGALNILLADTFALYLKTKSFHWHVSEPHFRDYHLLLDEQAGRSSPPPTTSPSACASSAPPRCARSARSPGCSACSTTTPTMSRRRTCWPSSATTPAAGVPPQADPRSLRRAWRRRHRQPARELDRRGRAAGLVPVRGRAHPRYRSVVGAGAGPSRVPSRTAEPGEQPCHAPHELPPWRSPQSFWSPWHCRPRPTSRHRSASGPPKAARPGCGSRPVRKIRSACAAGSNGPTAHPAPRPAR